MIVLDTDTLSLLQHGRGADHDRVFARLDAHVGEPIHITIVSFEEQMRGWMAYLAKATDAVGVVGRYRRLRALLADFQTRPILDFDDLAAETFESLRRQQIRVGTLDLRIAAIVLSNGGQLITRNLKDFRKVPGLMCDDWTTV